MRKRPAMVGVFLLLVLVVSLFVPSIAVSSVDAQYSFGVKDGNRVYVDDADAYISAEPHTLTAEGYVYLKVTSKAYGGKLDVCFGFDSKQAYPTRLELYDPQVEVVQHELNVSVYWGRPEYRVSYSFTKAVGSTVYGGCVWVDYDNEFISSANKTSIAESGGQTAGSEWVTVLTQIFDVGYLDTKMFYWSTEETLYWRSILQESGFEEEAFSFQGMTIWYLGNAALEKGKEYYLRMWLTIVPTLNSQMREFFVGFKPNGQSFEQSVAGGSFRSLDPWYSASWDFRKSHVITAASGAGTNYPVRILVHSGSGWDSGADVYCAGKCQSDFDDIRFTNSAGDGLLDYWLEGISGSVGTFWVEVADDLSSTSRTVYVYYGNSGASNISNGAATFAFFDDFSSSPNGWTLSNSVISGGLLDLSDVGYPNVAHAYKSRPSGYDNYRFRFAEQTATTNMGWRAYAREGGTPPDNPPMISAYDYYYDPISQARFITQGNVATSPTLTPTRDDDWHRIEVTKYSSSYTLVWDSLTATCTDNTAETGSNIGFCHIWSNDAHLYVDWVFLSKFVSPEPGHGSWSPEEGPNAVMLWGTQQYAESNETWMGGTPERILSGQVSSDIMNLFSYTGEYHWQVNGWGDTTQPDNVYDCVEESEDNYAFAAFFYKGHSHSLDDCDDPNCNFRHYAVYDNEGYDDAIWDYSVHEQMNSYIHRLVFLWTCGSAWSNATGGFNGGHSWGWEASFMGTTDLNTNAYTETTDNSNRCFIGFDGFSIWYRTGTGYQNHNYGDFVEQFFYHLLQGRTIKEALNYASYDTHGVYYNQCPLYYGYDMVDPRWPYPTVTCYMRVHGDGDLVIPH